MKIPAQYLPIMPYIILKEAEGFIQYLKNVFEATEQEMVRRENGAVMHAELRMGDAVVMIGGANEQWGEKTSGMYLYVNRVDDVFSRALKNNSKVLMEPADQSYGRSAGFDDPFGNQWWIVEAKEA